MTISKLPGPTLLAQSGMLEYPWMSILRIDTMETEIIQWDFQQHRQDLPVWGVRVTIFGSNC